MMIIFLLYPAPPPRDFLFQSQINRMLGQREFQYQRNIQTVCDIVSYIIKYERRIVVETSFERLCQCDE